MAGARDPQPLLSFHQSALSNAIVHRLIAINNIAHIPTVNIIPVSVALLLVAVTSVMLKVVQT